MQYAHAHGAQAHVMWPQVLRQLDEALSASRVPGVADDDAKAAELKVRRLCN